MIIFVRHEDERYIKKWQKIHVRHYSSSHVMIFSALTLSVSVVLKQSHSIIHLRQQANMGSVRPN